MVVKAGHGGLPKRVVLDIDDTFDRVHGRPATVLVNAYYDDYGFQPIVVFDEEGRFVTALLRPGKRPSGLGSAFKTLTWEGTGSDTLCAGASGCCHPTRLLTPACRRKRGKARQVDGADHLFEHRHRPPADCLLAKSKSVRTGIFKGLAANL